MSTIRWGIIGCGDVTERKSGPGFQKADGSSLVAVMRRNSDLAKDYARRHNVPKWYNDAIALIVDPDIDAVYIATPPSSHKEYALLAAQAGKPVYVEKPMAINTAECQAMIDACQKANVLLFVAYYRRSLERFLKIKELIDANVIGDIRCVNITMYQPNTIDSSSELPWRVRPEISGGGIFVDLAPHMLDFLDFVFGPIESVRSSASNLLHIYPAEDYVSALWKFSSGVQGAGVWCFSASEKIDRTEIIGSLGSLTYSTFDAEPIVIKTASGAKHITIGYPEHIQQPFIQSVVNELHGTGTCPSHGESGLRTTRVIEEILKSYYK